jgi:hypothetical protein
LLVVFEQLEIRAGQVPHEATFRIDHRRLNGHAADFRGFGDLERLQDHRAAHDASGR